MRPAIDSGIVAVDAPVVAIGQFFSQSLVTVPSNSPRGVCEG